MFCLSVCSQKHLPSCIPIEGFVCYLAIMIMSRILVTRHDHVLSFPLHITCLIIQGILVTTYINAMQISATAKLITM
jgi:hypothetical protein